MHSYFELPDGALLAYEILGQEHANLRPPLALVSGMGGLRSDWMRLASALSCNRTGEFMFSVSQLLRLLREAALVRPRFRRLNSLDL